MLHVIRSRFADGRHFLTACLQCDACGKQAPGPMGLTVDFESLTATRRSLRASGARRGWIAPFVLSSRVRPGDPDTYIRADLCPGCRYRATRRCQHR